MNFVQLIKLSFVHILILFHFVNSETHKNDRQKRFLLFPASSTIGILAAIAVPIELPHRNVFMSYNFEANYNSPYQAFEYIPGPLTRLDLVDGRKNDDAETSRLLSSENSTAESAQKIYISKRSLLSRGKAYYILQKKLEHLGYPGMDCVLRMICECNIALIGSNNGVLGDIFHVIFSPSTSKMEKLPKYFYDAEFDGKNKNCKKYCRKCDFSILDLISEVY